MNTLFKRYLFVAVFLLQGSSLLPITIINLLPNNPDGSANSVAIVVNGLAEYFVVDSGARLSPGCSFEQKLYAFLQQPRDKKPGLLRLHVCAPLVYRTAADSVPLMGLKLNQDFLMLGRPLEDINCEDTYVISLGVPCPKKGPSKICLTELKIHNTLAYVKKEHDSIHYTLKINEDGTIGIATSSNGISSPLENRFAVSVPGGVELLKLSLDELSAPRDELAKRFILSCCASCSVALSAPLLCSACCVQAYCNVVCQKNHWPQHKKECKALAALYKK